MLILNYQDQKNNMRSASIPNSREKSSLLARRNLTDNITKSLHERYQSELAVNRRVTFLLVTISFAYTASNIPFSILYINRIIFNDFGLIPHRTIQFVASFFLNSIGLFKFLIYYYCNKPFRQVLSSYIRLK